MKITLEFHRSLLKYTDGVKNHTITCDDFTSLVSAISHLFPNLGNYIRRVQATEVLENLCLLDKNKKLIKSKVYEFNKFKENHSSLFLVPMMAGAGGKKGSFLQIAIGIALIGATFAFPGLAGTQLLGTTLGKMMMSTGLNMILGGIMGLMQETPKPPEKQISDNQERIDNNMFSGLQNTTSSNNNVPVNYGSPRVSGQLVSGFVKSLNHGKGDLIKVSESFGA